MGTIRFVLRTKEPNREGLCPIQLVYQIAGKRAYYTTKENLKEVNWSAEKQAGVYLNKGDAKKLLPLVKFDLLPTQKEIDEVNSNLLQIRQKILNIEKRFELDNITDYTADMVVKLLKGKRATEPEPVKDVFTFIDRYIKDNSAARVKGSLTVYKSLKTHLGNFRNDGSIDASLRRVTFENIDYPFFQRFQNFLIKQRKKKTVNGVKIETDEPLMNNVTIAKQLSTLKTFLSYAGKQGIDITTKYKDFSIKKESLEVIALTSDEFETLWNFDLSNNKALAQVRDTFIFSCVTGLRFSDLKNLKRDHIKRDEIRLVITKTKQHLVIPLNIYSHTILSRYSEMYKPLPVISNQKMNAALKRLCKLAGIDEPIIITRAYGGESISTTYPKYELVSCHTGRKTFATLSLEKGMSAEEVKQIGGWKTYASFARYVNITEKRSKIVMAKAWGDIPKAELIAV